MANYGLFWSRFFGLMGLISRDGDSLLIVKAGGIGGLDSGAHPYRAPIGGVGFFLFVGDYDRLWRGAVMVIEGGSAAPHRSVPCAPSPARVKNLDSTRGRERRCSKGMHMV